MSSKVLEELLADIKTAMKAGERDQVTALRSLHAQIKDATVNVGKDVSDEMVGIIVGKAIKQRKDSIEQFQRADRNDLAEKEQREIDLFSKYQPEQLSEEEIASLAQKAIAESGATGKQDMGKVMKVLMPGVKGRADGKLVNQVVQRLLGRNSESNTTTRLRPASFRPEP